MGTTTKCVAILRSWHSAGMVWYHTGTQRWRVFLMRFRFSTLITLCDPSTLFQTRRGNETLDASTREGRWAGDSRKPSNSALEERPTAFTRLATSPRRVRKRVPARKFKDKRSPTERFRSHGEFRSSLESRKPSRRVSSNEMCNHVQRTPRLTGRHHPISHSPRHVDAPTASSAVLWNRKSQVDVVCRINRPFEAMARPPSCAKNCGGHYSRFLRRRRAATICCDPSSEVGKCNL